MSPHLAAIFSTINSEMIFVTVSFEPWTFASADFYKSAVKPTLINNCNYLFKTKFVTLGDFLRLRGIIARAWLKAM
jgi:hypothetical protein